MYMRTLLLLFLFLGMLPVRAASVDDVRVSLLTCAPGTEIYALFGHTAIRYENPSKQQDWVFNYGMFNFREPNFVMRFVKGETDYQLGVVPFKHFDPFRKSVHSLPRHQPIFLPHMPDLPHSIVNPHIRSAELPPQTEGQASALWRALKI